MDCPGCKLVDAHIEMDETPDGKYKCCRCGRIENAREDFLADTYIPQERHVQERGENK